jgi:pimeloyl-ACP methyl ester carboxylesterase
MMTNSCAQTQNQTQTTVTSTVYGGNTTQADLDHFAQITNLITQGAKSVEDLQSLCRRNQANVVFNEVRLALCPLNSPLGFLDDVDAFFDPDWKSRHIEVPQPAIGSQLTDSVTKLEPIKNTIYDLADAVARAHDVYSSADEASASFLDKILGIVAAAHPFLSFGAAAIIGEGSNIAKDAQTGNGGNHEWLFSTDPFQEGLINGIGKLISPGNPDGAVGRAANTLSPFAQLFEDLFMGSKLDVTELHPSQEPIGSSQSVSEAMANLQQLADQEGPTGYGTVAVQKYVDAQGNVKWLILIPGTDSHMDTAVGWPQNVQLMSDDNDDRMNASSAKLVQDAMEKAGIGKDDPVTMVGHSQGGIIAASLAAGLKDDYNITHIVTAGSPIANHPIPSKTWVTSIEDEGELVSRLDGSPNPTTGNWVTVEGDFSTTPLDDGSDPFSTKVPDSPQTSEITHAMNYQRAALENAEELGSPALENSEKHFADQIEGQLVETRYYQGRLEN